MKIIAYLLGFLQIFIALAGLTDFASRGAPMNVMMEVTVAMWFGFGTVCICLGILIGAVQSGSVKVLPTA